MISFIIMLSLGVQSIGFANSIEFQDSSQSALDHTTLRDVIRHTEQLVLLSPSVVQDAVVRDYLQNLGNRLSQHSTSIQYPFRFFMIKHDEINAFATLGNYVGVHSGLVMQTQSESELAAVLAHEIAHCQQQHLMHMIQHQQDMRVPMLLGLLGAIGLSVLNPGLGQGAVLASAAGFEQDKINFTRSYEREADQIGINLLHKTHFRVASMAEFFNRLRLQERYYGNQVPALLRTHPVTSSRIAQARDYSASLKQGPIEESIDYNFIRERLRVMTADKLNELQSYYKTQLRQHPKQSELYYGAAMTEQRLENDTKSLQLLQQIPQYHQHWIIKLATSHAYLQNRPDKAIAILAKLYNSDNERDPIIIAYTSALTKNGRASEAIKLLQRALINRRKDALFWHMLAEAENNTGQKARAYFSAAHVNYLLYNKKRALKFLNLAMKMADKDKDLQAQIQVKLLEYGDKEDNKQKR
jgi:beta-barrel assembly-enhancing protease